MRFFTIILTILYFFLISCSKETKVEVIEDTDVPTEENKDGFSLNFCENQDEIFDGIEDMSFFSEVDDIWYEEDGKTKEFPPELKQKLISLDEASPCLWYQALGASGVASFFLCASSDLLLLFM